MLGGRLAQWIGGRLLAIISNLGGNVAHQQWGVQVISSVYGPLLVLNVKFHRYVHPISKTHIPKLAQAAKQRQKILNIHFSYCGFSKLTLGFVHQVCHRIVGNATPSSRPQLSFDSCTLHLVILASQAVSKNCNIKCRHHFADIKFFKKSKILK